MLRTQSAFLPMRPAGLCPASVGTDPGRRPHQRSRAGARLWLCRRPSKQQVILTKDTKRKHAKSSYVAEPLEQVHCGHRRFPTLDAIRMHGTVLAAPLQACTTSNLPASQVHRFNAEAGIAERQRSAKRHAESCRAVALSPDGAALASGAADGSMTVADMETGKVRLNLA